MWRQQGEGWGANFPAKFPAALHAPPTQCLCLPRSKKLQDLAAALDALTASVDVTKADATVDSDKTFIFGLILERIQGGELLPPLLYSFSTLSAHCQHTVSSGQLRHRTCTNRLHGQGRPAQRALIWHPGLLCCINAVWPLPATTSWTNGGRSCATSIVAPRVRCIVAPPSPTRACPVAPPPSYCPYRRLLWHERPPQSSTGPVPARAAGAVHRRTAGRPGVGQQTVCWRCGHQHAGAVLAGLV